MSSIQVRSSRNSNRSQLKSRNSNRSQLKSRSQTCNSTSSSSTFYSSNHPTSSTSTSPSLSLLSISVLILTTLSTLIQSVNSSPSFPYPPPSSSSSSASYSSLSKRQVIYNESQVTDGQKVDFYSPINRTQEGQMLTIIPGPYAIGLGEPLNAIVSARSDPQVLTPEGFLLWSTSINFGVSCLGQANGTQQLASLGDGRINRTQGNGDGNNGVLRYNYGNAFIGTCQETFKGGNHFRWWIQNGTEANSGAYFLAVSAELPLAQNHLIMPNGYNKGRDEMIGNATLSNGTTYGAHWFNTTVQWVEAGILLNATSDKINHASEVAVDGMPAQDGRVAVLTVKYLAGPRMDDRNHAVKIGLGESKMLIGAMILVAVLPMILI